jgi:hypothetical protein
MAAPHCGRPPGVKKAKKNISGLRNQSIKVDARSDIDSRGGKNRSGVQDDMFDKSATKFSNALNESECTSESKIDGSNGEFDGKQKGAVDQKTVSNHIWEHSGMKPSLMDACHAYWTAKPDSGQVTTQQAPHTQATWHLLKSYGNRSGLGHMTKGRCVSLATSFGASVIITPSLEQKSEE